MLPGAQHLIYRAIGGVLRSKLDLDSINTRARTNGRQKIGWALLATLQTNVSWPLQRAIFGDAQVGGTSPLTIQQITDKVGIL